MSGDGFIYTYVRWSSSVDATTVGRMVERIEAEHGTCTPRVFVDYARPVDSPTHESLHPRAWDEAWCAEEHRVTLARRLIANLRIVVEDKPQQAPAFVHVVHAPQCGGGYVNALRAMSVEELRQQVLDGVLQQLAGLRHRHASLVELKSVWEAVDEVVEPPDDEGEAD